MFGPRIGRAGGSTRQRGWRSAPRLRRLLAPALAAALLAACAAAAGAVPARAAATSAAAGRSSSMLVFLPQTTPRRPQVNSPTVLDEIARRPSLSLGMLQSSQGGYDMRQVYLDIGQGARVSFAAYSPHATPPLSYIRLGARRGFIYRWPDERARAADTPASIKPALLADSVPGGAGYAAVSGPEQPAAIVAADGDGLLSDVSLGPARTLAARAQRLLSRHRLVVVALPQRRPGLRALDRLLRARAAGEQLIVVQAPPPDPLKLIPIGIAAGPRANPRVGTLTSATTRRHGIVTTIDIAPTILHHLGIEVPRDMTGAVMSIAPGRNESALLSADRRLGVTSARRDPMYVAVAAGWVLVVLLLGLLGEERGLRLGMRAGGLALLWLPSTTLVSAVFVPSHDVELAISAGGAFLLALLTDRILSWPRGPALPAFVGLAFYTVDLARGSPLIAASVLGPNPRSGSRFFGIGNEMEPVLPIMLFVGLAALLSWRGSRRRQAALFAACGVVLAGVIGSGRLGADVGGVITVTAGTAVAVIVLLFSPGPDTGSHRRPPARAIVLAVLTPIVALVALAALDLATGANGHFTRDFIHTGGGGTRMDVIVRKLELAANNFADGTTAVLTAILLLAAIWGIRYRRRTFGRLYASAAWRAAFAGGFGGAVAGALTNDSGPVLVIAGVTLLASLVPYARATPLGAGAQAREPLSERAGEAPAAAGDVDQGAAGGQGERPLMPTAGKRS